jgi:hypothetical protein
MKHLAIVLTLFTVLSAGAPVAGAHGRYRSYYSPYRGYAVPRSQISVGFTVTSGRSYWRTRPSYAYVRRSYSPYSRVVRVYRYQPYPVVNRYVVYRRSCY